MISLLKKMQKNNQQGFTLVELMIVVAIIGILAAIAIPQFAAYRQRAFNSSAQSDVRNTKTAEEVLQADHQVYGATENAALPGAGVPAGGLGAILTGPLAPSTTADAGAALSSTNAAGTDVGIGIGVGNNIFLKADVTAAGGAGSFIITARHDMGPRSYSTDSDTTAIYYIDDPGMIGLGALTVVPVAAVNNQDDLFTTPLAVGVTGDVVTTNWTAQ